MTSVRSYRDDGRVTPACRVFSRFGGDSSSVENAGHTHTIHSTVRGAYGPLVQRSQGELRTARGKRGGGRGPDVVRVARARQSAVELRHPPQLHERLAAADETAAVDDNGLAGDEASGA